MVKLSLLQFLAAAAAAAVAVEITITTRSSSSSTTSSRPSFLFVRAQEDEGTTDAPVSAPSSLPPNVPSAEDQQCIIESTSLNKDPDVGSATQDLLTTTKDELLANFTDFCSIFQRKCTIDLAQYSSNLQQACQAATVVSPDGTTTTNGQFHDYQIVIECRTDTFAPDAIEIPGSVQLDNVPTCIGQSCDPTNLPSEITELLNQLLETLTTEIDNQLGDSFVCQSNINNSGAGAGGSGSVKSMVGVTAAAAFTTIMMT